MLLDLLILLSALYVLQICIFAIGAHRAQYSSDAAYTPTVSVVIAARNEQENIRPCLDSLVRLTYPKDRLQIIMVNDRSTDDTGKIIAEYASHHPFITLLNALEDPQSGLTGKPNAVAQGVDHASGEIIMFTDADCVVPEGWVEETVKYYHAPEVGLVAGFTSLRARNTFEAIQSLDWFVLFSIAAATLRLGFPVTAVGNNLSVRRSAYDATGGFRKIPFSITEDYALFHAVTSLPGVTARFPIDEKALVVSLPCESWPALFRQKKRWFLGGAGMDMKSLLLFTVGYAFKALIVANAFVSGIVAVLVPLALKLFSDYLLVRTALKRFQKQRLLLYLLPFELYYIVYVLIFPPIVLLSRNVAWKGRKFAGKNTKAL